MPEATLHRLVDQLAVRFAGVFARETIVRYVFESYTALARTAAVTTHLPVLAGRFATERLTALAQAEGAIDSDVCEILFACVHNAERSQMAAALMAHHGGDRVHVRSAGSQPTASIDAAGHSIGEVRAIRTDIDARVRALLAELHPADASR